MSHLRKPLLAAGLLVLAASMTLAAEPASYHVVAETASGVTVVAEFPPPVMAAGEGPGGRWTEARVAGAEIPWRIGEPGLPEYTLLLAVPVGAAARLEVVARSESVLPASAPPPILRWDADAGRALPHAAEENDLAMLDDGETAILEDLGQDHDGDGRINALDWDADDDGLPDGMERGITTPDGGGAADGAEDRDVNGRVDAGETDPRFGSDDPACAAQPAAEIPGLRLTRDGDDVVLTWSSALGDDPCLLYRVYIAPDPGRPDAFSKFEDAGLETREEHRHREALADDRSSYYLINGVSVVAGEGVLGHFDR